MNDLAAIFQSESNKPRNEREQLELKKHEISYGIFQQGEPIAFFYTHDSAVIALRRAGFVKNEMEKTFDVWMIPDNPINSISNSVRLTEYMALDAKYKKIK